MINLLLANDFFSQYGMLIVLILILLGLFAYSVFKKKNDDTYRAGLREQIQVGAKVKTYAGVYGTVVSKTETTDGTIVLLSSGEGKKISYIQVHIDAIYGIDTKEDVKDEPIVETALVDAEVTPMETIETVEEVVETKEVEETPKKKRSTSTKSKKTDK